MSFSFNSVCIGGNLTSDPEIRYTPSGNAICSFGLALNRKFKKDDKWENEVEFFDVVAWGKQAETCGTHLAKGRAVMIKGRLQQETWEKDGQKRSKVKVVAEHVEFLPRYNAPDTGDVGGADGDDEGSIPF